ncbi:MAG: TonB-dependent receptor [Ignavibacteriales bacterium]|nr:TonB-dependent receptor [Ignavibacteriales bacterium]
MKKNLIITLITISFFYFFNSQLYSQEIGTLRGTVVDSTSREALPFANVLIKELNKGTATDSKGLYTITSIPANKTYTIIVSYVGYQSKSLTAFVSRDKITELNIKLSPTGFEMQTIEKTGERIKLENEIDVSLKLINIKEIETLPKGVETDIFRSLQYIAGVQSSGDVSARYFVRGGSSNQNLVLINDAPIYSPFHSLGLFGVVDPEMIKSAEFYKGGFPTEYSGRISSVLRLITKDGNRNDYSGSASASFLAGKFMLQGPIPDGSFIITGRKSYSNEILKKFLNNKHTPINFYDLSFKVNFLNDKIFKNANFIAHGFFSKDILNYDNPFKEDFWWGNKIWGIKYYQVTDSPLYYEISFYHSNFRGKVEPNYSNKRIQDNEIKDYTFDANFNYLSDSKDEFAAGFKITELYSTLYLEDNRGFLTDIKTQGSNISLFAKYKLMRFGNFGIEFGSRLNLTRLAAGTSGEYFFEPRVNLTYRFIPEVALKLAWGVYNQELITLSDEDEILTVFEPWVVTPNYLNPPQAIHYIAGIESNFLQNFFLNVEAYYKHINNFSAVNERKFFPTDKDLIAGMGYSYGIETSISFQKEPINITTSYTLSWAYKKIYERIYYPRYDSRHNINFSFEFNLGAGWKTSIAWFYNSGYPFTQILGYYDKLYFQDPLTQNLIFDPYIPYISLADKNLGRLPDYHRLDFSLSKKIQIGILKFFLDFNIINLYDRANIFYYDRKTGERINMLPFLPSANIKIEI